MSALIRNLSLLHQPDRPVSLATEMSKSYASTLKKPPALGTARADKQGNEANDPIMNSHAHDFSSVTENKLDKVAIDLKATEKAAKRPPPHDRILEVARELFCRDGIHATGIDRILLEAGASKMTLYSHFGSKEALLREVLVREGAAQREALFTVIDQAGPSPSASLYAVVDALRAWFESDRFYGCAFMNAAAEHSKGTGAKTWLRDLTRTHHANILGRLESLAEQAGYPEPALLARQVLLIMDGAIAALMVSGDPNVLTISERNLQAVLAQPG